MIKDGWKKIGWPVPLSQAHMASRSKIKKKPNKTHSPPFFHTKWFLELSDEYILSKYLILTSEICKSQGEVLRLLKDKIW